MRRENWQPVTTMLGTAKMLSLVVQVAVLSLQCEGTSMIAVQTTGQTNVWAGGESANANSVITSTARQSDRVLVEVDGVAGLWSGWARKRKLP